MIVIFDWDGTLCDSTSRIVEAMQSAAVARGMPPLGEDSVLEIIGLGLPEAIALLFPDAPQVEHAALAETYSQHYIAVDQVPASLFPGALEMFASLRAMGVELAVATGKSRRGLNRVLSGLGLEAYFDATRCADETRSKPHPQMLEEILCERSRLPAQALMVGDTEFDLGMAQAAGIASIGVSFGVHSVERLRLHDPIAVVEGLAEIPALVGDALRRSGH